MNNEEEKTLRRKIFLTGQGITLLRQKKEALRERLSLLKIKARLEERMKKGFDSKISGMLDAVMILLEN